MCHDVTKFCMVIKLTVVVPVFLHVPGNNTKISRGIERLRYLEGGNYALTRETEKKQEIRHFRKKVTFELLSF